MNFNITIRMFQLCVLFKLLSVHSTQSEHVFKTANDPDPPLMRVIQTVTCFNI